VLNHLGGLKGRYEDVIVVGDEEFGSFAVYLLLEVLESPSSLSGSPLEHPLLLGLLLGQPGLNRINLPGELLQLGRVLRGADVEGLTLWAVAGDEGLDSRVESHNTSVGSSGRLAVVRNWNGSREDMVQLEGEGQEPFSSLLPDNVDCIKAAPFVASPFLRGEVLGWKFLSEVEWTREWSPLKVKLPGIEFVDVGPAPEDAEQLCTDCFS